MFHTRIVVPKSTSRMTLSGVVPNAAPASPHVVAVSSACAARDLRYFRSRFWASRRLLSEKGELAEKLERLEDGTLCNSVSIDRVRIAIDV